MKNYRVILSALAHVEQVHYVEAENEQAANEKAMAKVDDTVWEYQGLTEGFEPGDVIAEAYEE